MVPPTSQTTAQSPDSSPPKAPSPPSPPSSNSSSNSSSLPSLTKSSPQPPPSQSSPAPPNESPPSNSPSPKSSPSPSSTPSDDNSGNGDGNGNSKRSGNNNGNGNDSSPSPPARHAKSSPPQMPSPPGSQQPSPPALPGSNGGDSSSSNQHNKLNVLVALGVVGGILALIVIMVIISCVSKKKRRRKPHNPMQYYVDPSGRKGNDYYVSTQPPKWGNQDLPSPQGGGWHAKPPPMLNTEDLGNTFSGPHAPPLPPPSPTLALGFNKSTFTYEELAAATSGFTQNNLLGQGGFGYVHKGVLPNGKEIAVKSLKAGSGQGEREFQAEVDIISRVHHRHLVSLVGYCISGAQRMLVYDFVPNKTLEYHLHGKGLPPMNWPTRLKIALGSAKGLAYLHEDCHPRIIHRDIKTANILLDFKFEAMVADFGLAKLSSDNHTHVSTRVMGTFGYLAPEYASSGKLTEKSDVFSYGVMLLELITGRRPCDSSHTFMEDSLVDWARPVLSHALSDGNYDELVDPKLEGNYDPMEMARMVACAAASVRHSARRRPKMSQIVRALDGDVSLEDLNEGMRPGQSMLFSSGSDYDSDIYANNKRRNNMRKAPIASPEYSGEYSGPMGDYGHHRSSSSDDVFSGELTPIGNQRLRAHPQL